MLQKPLFSLKHQFPRYAEYHHDRLNQQIHIIFVPLILWTSSVFLANIPTPSFFDSIPFTSTTTTTAATATATPSSMNILGVWVEFNIPFALTVVYAMYYIVLDSMTGVLFLPFLVGSCVSATWFATSKGWGEVRGVENRE